MVMRVNLHQAKELAIFYIQLGLLPMLHGSFGVGKSSVAQEIADEFNLLLIDKRLAQCDPTDLQGFPDKANGRSTYLPPEDIPLEGDPLPIKYPAIKKGQIMLYGPKIGTPADKDYPAVFYDGWLLFMDEINSADEEVQAASYKITLDRKVGQKKVHSACAMLAAGNLETDGAIVNDMSSALKTRLVHIIISNDLPVFQKWASKNGIDSRITSFLNYKPTYLHDIPEQNDDPTYSCNRTWEFANRVMKNMEFDNPLFIAALSGCISHPKAMELKAHVEVFSKLPEYSKILADADLIDIPHDMSTLWAMLGSIGDKAQKADMDQLMKFVTRLPKEHQVVLMLDIGAKNRSCMSATAANRWCQANANVIMD